MLQEIFNLAFILIFYWKPSASSICYQLIGLFLWLRSTFLLASTHGIYKIAMMISGTFLVLKSILILEIYFADYLNLISNLPILLDLISIKPSDSILILSFHLVPELAILVLSFTAVLLKFNTQEPLHCSWFYRVLGVVTLWLCSCSMWNLPGLVYNLGFIYWAVLEGEYFNRVKFIVNINNKLNHKLLSGIISCLSLGQTLLSFSFPLTNFTKNYQIDLIGLVDTSSFQIISIILVYVVFSFIGRVEASNTKNKKNQVSNSHEDLSQPLVINDERSPTFNKQNTDSSKSSSTIKKIMAISIHFCLNIGLFLWIEFNPGWTGILLILFVVNIILVDIYDAIGGILVPLLILSYLCDYLSLIYAGESSMNFSFMLVTIMLACLLIKYHNVILEIKYSSQQSKANQVKASDSFWDLNQRWYVQILMIFISHTYLFTLIVLFLIGLSDINLLHTGIMILFFIYLSEVEYVKKNWWWLVCYMICMMFIRETWTNAKVYIDPEFHDSYIVKIIGLETGQKPGEFIKQDGLNWILLLFCYLQHLANQYKFENQIGTYKKNIFFKYIANAYKYFSNIEFWLIYIVLFVASFLKDANILNFIRCFMIMYIMTKHLSSPYSNISSNFKKINQDLNVLRYYCMGLLAIRYVYQFLRDIKHLTKFEKLGLEIYDQTKDLYYSTSLDTILVVASALAFQSNRMKSIKTQPSNAMKISQLGDKNTNSLNDSFNLPVEKDSSFDNKMEKLEETKDLKFDEDNCRKSRAKTVGAKLNPDVRNEINRSSAYYSAHLPVDKKQSSLIYYSIARTFKYILLLAIGLLCIFWKVSLTMCIYLVIFCIYQTRICFKFHSENLELKDILNKPKILAQDLTKNDFKKPDSLKKYWKPEWELRAQLWRYLFIWTLSCILMSYIRYISTIDIVSYDVFLDGIYLFLGYNDQQKNLIFIESLGYFVIFTLLVIERKCLEHTIPDQLKLKENGWDSDRPEDSKKNITSQDKFTIFENNYSQQFSKKSSETLKSIQKTIDCEQSIEKLESKIKYISALCFLKAVTKVIITSSILFLAFYRLTIISTINVFWVFLIQFVNRNNQTIILSIMMSFLIIIQYCLILSNISSQVSPEVNFKANEKELKEMGIPWRELLELQPEEQEYLNLGTSKKQLNYMTFDILIMILILIYWFYLSNREYQLTYLEEKLRLSKKRKEALKYESINRNHTKKPLPREDFKRVKIQSIHSNEGIRTKSKTTNFKSKLYDWKLLFYRFSRFSVVIIFLLFTSKNTGLMSLLYVLFCFIFLYNENLIIYNSFEIKKQNLMTPKVQKSNKKNFQGFSKNTENPNFRSKRSKSMIDLDLNFLNKFHSRSERGEKKVGINNYLNLLNYFLRLMCFDLLLQIIVQVPLYGQGAMYEYLFGQEGWITGFGVYKLWLTEKDAKVFNDKRFDSIWFKISTFSILLMIQAMMKSQDFRNSHKLECLKIQEQSNYILKSERKNSKIFKYITSEKKKTLNNNFQGIVKNIRIWNENFKGNSSQITRDDFFERLNQDQDSFEQEAKNHRGNFLIKFLAESINQYLFQDFLRNIRRTRIISLNLPDYKKFLEKEKKREELRNRFYYQINLNECTETQTKQNQEVKENIEILNNIIYDHHNDYDYEVKVKDFFQLILYSLASNTRSLVYFFLILNHFHYASLVSLVYPMTLFGYAMLEYPSPIMKYFRIMLVYTSTVLFIKFVFQLEILQKVDFFKDYKDPWNIGFKRVLRPGETSNNHDKFHGIYDQNFLEYMLYDALVLFSLLCHEYYMIRIGMWKKISEPENKENNQKELEDDYQKNQEEDQPEVSILTLKEDLQPDTNQKTPDIEKSKRINPGCLQQLVTKILSYSSFLRRLIPKNRDEKPGKDLYLYTFLMQLIILFYIFFFFNKLVGQSEDITRSLKANQFQGRMVISMFIVVVLIIFDRYVYIQHTSIANKKTESDSKGPDLFIDKSEYNSKISQKVSKSSKEIKLEWAIDNLLIIKLLLYSLLLVVVHWVIFWYFPSLTQAPFYDEKNFYLQIFYILYLIYLAFEAQQFRYGLPNYTYTSFPLMRYFSGYSSGLFKIYKGMPFLYELRTVIDWTFTKTSLNIYQWFKFEEIQSQLYYNECIQIGLKKKSVGKQIPLKEKIQYGACSLFLMLVIILLPLFLFSTLNPITEENQILSAGLNVNLIIGKRWFKIYSLSSAESIDKISDIYTEQQFNLRFPKHDELRETDFDIMYRIDMPESADANWDITSYAELQLSNKLESIKNRGKKKNEEFQVEIEMMIKRRYPVNKPITFFTKNYTLSQEDAGVLHQMIVNKDQKSLEIKNFTYKVFRLPSAGDKIIPFSYEKDQYQRDLKISLIHDHSGRFWNVSSYSYNDGSIGLRFYILSDYYSTVTFNFSIITFYISIVYFMGRIIRMVTVGSGLNIVMTEMKNCLYLRTLCSAIFISRMAGDLDEEERLYYELIDILRSPEFIKLLTGSSSLKVKND